MCDTYFFKLFKYEPDFKLIAYCKGQLISKQNCRAVTSPKKQTKGTQDTRAVTSPKKPNETHSGS